MHVTGVTPRVPPHPKRLSYVATAPKPLARLLIMKITGINGFPPCFPAQQVSVQVYKTWPVSILRRQKNAFYNGGPHRSLALASLEKYTVRFMRQIKRKYRFRGATIAVLRSTHHLLLMRGNKTRGFVALRFLFNTTCFCATFSTVLANGYVKYAY